MTGPARFRSDTVRGVSEQQSAGQGPSSEQQDGWLEGTGLALGLCLGTALGLTVLDDVGVGLGIGLAIGVAVDAVQSRRRR